MLGVNTPALPASLRRTNQRTVISLLQRLGCASRADLAKAAGISQPTAGKIISYLLDLGVLQRISTGNHAGSEGKPDLPRLGRPGQMLRLDSERQRFIAVELGVTETLVATLPLALRLRDEWSCRFRTPGSALAWVHALKAAAIKAPPGLWGVLISVPGIIHESTCRALFSPNLHWLESVSLPELVQEVWPAPTLMVQEIRALALGHLSAEAETEDFFLVDFGQGVGGAVVCDGKLSESSTPLSGEFGHTPVAGNQRLCGCGAVGCLETLVSEEGLLESFSLAHRMSRPTWKMLAAHVAERGVEPWLADSLGAAAAIIAGALNILGVHRVIVTGTLAELPSCVVEHLRSGIVRGALWARFGEVVCESAPRRRGAGLVVVGIDRLVSPEDEDSNVRADDRPETENLKGFRRIPDGVAHRVRTRKQ